MEGFWIFITDTIPWWFHLILGIFAIIVANVTRKKQETGIAFGFSFLYTKQSEPIFPKALLYFCLLEIVVNLPLYGIYFVAKKTFQSVEVKTVGKMIATSPWYTFVTAFFFGIIGIFFYQKKFFRQEKKVFYSFKGGFVFSFNPHKIKRVICAILFAIIGFLGTTALDDYIKKIKYVDAPQRSVRELIKKAEKKLDKLREKKEYLLGRIELLTKEKKRYKKQGLLNSEKKAQSLMSKTEKILEKVISLTKQIKDKIEVLRLESKFGNADKIGEEKLLIKQLMDADKILQELHK